MVYDGFGFLQIIIDANCVLSNYYFKKTQVQCLSTERTPFSIFKKLWHKHNVKGIVSTHTIGLVPWYTLQTSLGNCYRFLKPN
jgi:hypothetical protein